MTLSGTRLHMWLHDVADPDVIDVYESIFEMERMIDKALEDESVTLKMHAVQGWLVYVDLDFYCRYTLDELMITTAPVPGSKDEGHDPPDGKSPKGRGGGPIGPPNGGKARKADHKALHPST